MKLKNMIIALLLGLSLMVTGCISTSGGGGSKGGAADRPMAETDIVKLLDALDKLVVIGPEDVTAGQKAVESVGLTLDRYKYLLRKVDVGYNILVMGEAAKEQYPAAEWPTKEEMALIKKYENRIRQISERTPGQQAQQPLLTDAELKKFLNVMEKNAASTQNMNQMRSHLQAAGFTMTRVNYIDSRILGYVQEKSGQLKEAPIDRSEFKVIEKNYPKILAIRNALSGNQPK